MIRGLTVSVICGHVDEGYGATAFTRVFKLLVNTSLESVVLADSSHLGREISVLHDDERELSIDGLFVQWTEF
ncbi:hypothetical protein KNN17_10845 [Arthrobacter bambusae]|uniref:hypothetical protein n=1 Tax=Arthrobacter bambusae TaxID=1338426 RepID=UPI001F512B58|nr:hypothetical protein [Arthrobacter bambusae]MCI0142076.1 hypothetical protein [Arthrobacter bambusae]